MNSRYIINADTKKVEKWLFEKEEGNRTLLSKGKSLLWVESNCVFNEKDKADNVAKSLN
jgi:predicted RNA-binding protein with PUA domain